MASIFPRIRQQPGSNLSFPWAEYVSKGEQAAFDANLGPEGVFVGCAIIVRWEDLGTACQELLGYCKIDALSNPNKTQLTRRLPYQHPRWNNLWCTRIVKVQGLKFTGKDIYVLNIPSDGQTGGPHTGYEFALLTLQFSRPPYAILGDNDILDGSGNRQEWLRYTDRLWTPSVQMLSREGMQFTFAEGKAQKSGVPFQGSVGTPICKVKLKRTWYQVPEAAVYDPTGFPSRLLKGPDSVSISTIADNGSGKCRVTSSSHGFITGQRVIISGVLGTIEANGAWDVTVVSSSQFDLDNSKFTNAYTSGGEASTIYVGSVNLETFFGMPKGVLLYEAPEITPAPLHLPPILMGLSSADTTQLQYNVTLHFEWFDPPLGGEATSKGHNCMPWSADALFYLVKSQGSTDVGKEAPALTPFGYQPFTKLFDPI